METTEKTSQCLNAPLSINETLMNRCSANDILALELEAAGTQWAAGQAPRDAFSTDVDGFQWMIYRNILTDVLHWDFVSYFVRTVDCTAEN